MGVIHKLNDNVVSFIVDYKKTNPSVSVRKLSAVTSEKFQIKVSKSSVNTVLKNAALSSSVGRRSLGKTKKEKFALPPFRKEEISGNMQKAGFIKSDTDTKIDRTSSAKEKVEKEERPPLLPDPIAQIQTQQPAEEKKEPISNDVKSDPDFEAYVKQVRDLKKGKSAGLTQGIGFVFLKAAEWDIFDKSMMAQLFKKHFSEKQAFNEFDAACEMYLFLKFLGVNTFEQASAYRKHGLWEISMLNGAIVDEGKTLLKLKELFEWDGSADSSHQLSMALEYQLEQQQLFSSVSRFKLFLEDSTQLNLDASLSMFSTKELPLITKHTALPINKAMAWLSNYVISNNSDVAFYDNAGEAQFGQGFFDMVAVFENFPGKQIKKILALDNSGEELADFTMIPNQKRTFLIGVPVRQKEFERLTGNVKWAGKKSYYHQETDRIFYYTQTATDYFNDRLQGKADEFRVATIWKEGEKEPFWAIVSNIEEASGEDMLRSYMTRWPYFGDSDNGEELSGQEDSEIIESIDQKTDSIDFNGIFPDFVGKLSQYSQYQFLGSSFFGKDVNHLNETVYSSSGTVHVAQDVLTVTLNIPKSSQYQNDLIRAAQKVNRRCICDFSGRRLWLETELI